MSGAAALAGRVADLCETNWVWRRRAAVVLVAAGVLAWGFDALVAEMVITTEPQWKHRPYVGSLTGHDVLILRMIVSILVALMLAIGIILLRTGQQAGRVLVIAVSVLVLAVQFAAMLLYQLPADPSEVFGDEPTPILLFRWKLMIFPFLTVVFLLGRRRASQFPAASRAA
ncbi:hypothetical protein [Nocardia lijiangensis]|uniref:hypothetical protein n=1 Tax=Nocardia lijiangensis TaxID=299618 RepID=UPI003D71160B